VFMNAGDPQKELEGMVRLKMTGQQIKDVLEYGVHDLVQPGAAKEGLFQRIRRLFAEPSASGYADEPGNFVQVSGLKYSFDLTRPPFTPGMAGPARISNVMVEVSPGNFAPIADNGLYTVLTRFHPLEKWQDYGLFGDKYLPAVLKDLQAAPVRLSPVELLGEYVNGKTLDPGVIGKVEGRITDLTPKPWQPTLRPGLSLVSYPGLSARSVFDTQALPVERGQDATATRQ